MRYNFLMPLSALAVLLTLHGLIAMNVLPPAEQLLSVMQGEMSSTLLLFAFLVILLESIVYVGFYFPGQFFAVLLVISGQPDTTDVVGLTLAMVLAATLGSAINYTLGYRSNKQNNTVEPTRLKHLLLAMIHINALAFYMFNQGMRHTSPKVILLAGFLNLPYYLALIAGTSLMSEQVGRLAENTQLMIIALLVWLSIAIYRDIKNWRQSQNDLVVE